MNREAFFTSIKGSLFRGRFSQSQVEGINLLLDATGGVSDRHCAYLLATALHETAHTMEPITEYGGRKYFDKYDTGRLAKALGNTPAADGDGFKYRGRGYVQITGHDNYEKASRKFGADFLGNPDLALDPQFAARILVLGCSEGWFTGKKLSDYNSFDSMRRVVNGMDDAQLIAGYAEAFLKAVQADEAVSGPITTAKPKSQSTTLGAAGVAGLSMAATASKDVKEVIGNLGISPEWILLAVGIAALLWIGRERLAKIRKWGI